MSLIDSLKQERKMSMNHWRYRLLHWTFNVTGDLNPTEPWRDSGLPRYLYTHFCPLFHLTNLIAIMSPIILFVRIIVAVFIRVAKVAVPVLDWLMDLIPNRSGGNSSPGWTRDDCIAAEKEKVRILLMRNPHLYQNFSYFYIDFRHEFNSISMEEIEVEFEKCAKLIGEAYERAKARKEALRKKLLFWTNFSSTVIKWILNVAYVALGLGVAYFLWLSTTPMFSFFSWLLSFDAVPFLLFLGKVVGIGLIGVVGGYWLLRNKKVKGFCVSTGHAVAAAAPSLGLVGTVIAAPFRWIAWIWRSSKEFIAVFYEENCPPIILVTPEEEKLQEAIDEAV